MLGTAEGGPGYSPRVLYFSGHPTLRGRLQTGNHFLPYRRKNTALSLRCGCPLQGIPSPGTATLSPPTPGIKARNRILGNPLAAMIAAVGGIGRAMLRGCTTVVVCPGQGEVGGRPLRRHTTRGHPRTRVPGINPGHARQRRCGEVRLLAIGSARVSKRSPTAALYQGL